MNVSRRFGPAKAAIDGINADLGEFYIDAAVAGQMERMLCRRTRNLAIMKTLLTAMLLPHNLQILQAVQPRPAPAGKLQPIQNFAAACPTADDGHSFINRWIA